MRYSFIKWKDVQKSIQSKNKKSFHKKNGLRNWYSLERRILKGNRLVSFKYMMIVMWKREIYSLMLRVEAGPVGRSYRKTGI